MVGQERLKALRWPARRRPARIEGLSRERRRELLEAAATRSRTSSGNALGRLRENRWPLIQTGVAAALAWLMATTVLGHPHPVFAPVAAIVALAATRGQRARRAVELMLGVALGIALGDLLTRVIGTGVLQLGVIVGLAMAAAILFGGGLLLLSEAGVSATLVVAVTPTTRGFPPTRLIDVFLGGAIALLFSQVLFPVHPVKVAREAAEAVVRELADTLREIAGAIECADADAAEAALIRARRVSAVWERFEEALEIGGEAAQYSPSRRRLRRPFAVYEDIGLPLDLVVGDVNVIARAALRALSSDEPPPDPLVDALRDLAEAADILAGQIGQEREDRGVRELALRAVDATSTDGEDDVAVSVLVAYAQATAIDLLRAVGVDREPARKQVSEIAQQARG